jgi:hypothetical protein
MKARLRRAKARLRAAPGRRPGRADDRGGGGRVQRRRLDAAPGEVCYWGPDTLHWTGIGGGHAAFIAWALSDALTEFYSSLRGRAGSVPITELHALYARIARQVGDAPDGSQFRITVTE